MLDSSGEIISQYRKLHMYDVSIPGKVVLSESAFTLPGDSVVPPVITPAGSVALSVVSSHTIVIDFNLIYSSSKIKVLATAA